MAEPSRALSVCSVEGLCNRLLILFSGRALAGASGRSFGMDWPLTPSCACPFDKLFQDEWGVRSTQEFDPAQWRDLRYIAPGRFPDFLKSAQPVLRLRHYGSLLRPNLYPSHIALEQQVREMWGSIKPMEEIQSRVDEFRQAHFRPTMIGVHVRRGDFLNARPELVDNLPDALAAVDQWLALAPEAGILLCTDDGATSPLLRTTTPTTGIRGEFIRRYGERVVSTTPRSLDRAAPESIQDAVQDLWLLRQTQYFVGTLKSTFSDFAVYGRDVPARMVGRPTAAYQARQQLQKRSGVYYVLRALGRIEFGADTPHDFIVRVYKQRIQNVRLWLKRT